MPKESTLMAGLFAVLLISVLYVGSMVVMGDRESAREAQDSERKQEQNELALALPANLDASAGQGSESVPSFLESDFLDESLRRLVLNGADLSQPMPSRHQVRSEQLDTAQALISWGLANGFSTSAVSVGLGHGSQPYFDVELIMDEVPSVEGIQRQGQRIRRGVSQFADARYVTWVGAIIPSNYKTAQADGR